MHSYVRLCLRASLLSLTLTVCLFSQIQPGSSFLPLTRDSATYLTIWDGSATMGFVVESAREFDRAVYGKVRFENPWMPHHWLVEEDSAGTWLVGYGVSNVDYHFARPSPLFMKGGSKGKTWTGEMTRVTLTGVNLTVNTPAGRITGASRFKITYNDGSAQEWTVAPGRGIIASGKSSADSQLTSSRAGSAPTRWVPRPASLAGGWCSGAGLSSIPVDSSLNLSQRRDALHPAVQAGSRFNVSSIPWTELEPAAGVVSAQRMIDEVSLARENGMEVALIIRTIDNGVAHRPADLRGLAWDHPTVVSRFVSAVNTLLARLPAPVRWLHLGYEVEAYLNANPGEVAAFKKFVSQAKAGIGKSRTDSIGLVFGFESTKANGKVFRELESVCDHVAFDYYALRPQQAYQHLGDDSPLYDVPLMLALAGDRNVLLTEAGYATSTEVSGGLDKQSRFFTALFNEVRASKGQIAAVNVWSLNDMPLSIVQQATASYALNVPGTTAFLSSLGVRYSSGAPKPSYSAILSSFNDLKLNPSCPQ